MIITLPVSGENKLFKSIFFRYITCEWVFWKMH